MSIHYFQSCIIMCTFNINFFHDCLRVVKLSSPNLNYIIIVGVILLYTSVFMYTYSAEGATLQTFLCNVRTLHAHRDYSMSYCVQYVVSIRHSFQNFNSSGSGSSHWATLCALLCC